MIKDEWVCVEQLQWHRTMRIDGLGYRLLINKTSGQKLPFVCYAGLVGTLTRRYLGPAPDLDTAKRKCENLETSSREPAPDVEPVQEPVGKTAKTSLRSLRSR